MSPSISNNLTRNFHFVNWGRFCRAVLECSNLEQLARAVGVIFEEFGRAKTDQEGVGLGLYINQKIVEAHGGKIWASSTPGQGSRFTFILPLSEPKALGHEL